MLQPVLGQEGSNHQSMTYPSLCLPLGKGDAAKASTASRNGEEGLLHRLEEADILTPSLNPAFYGCAAKATQPQPCLKGWRS